jgi:hypothetical protein
MHHQHFFSSQKEREGRTGEGGKGGSVQALLLQQTSNNIYFPIPITVSECKL